MKKLPAAETILFAYRFLFTQIGTVISIAGLPALAFAGADYATRAFLSASGTGGPANADPGEAEALAVVGSLLVAVIASSTAAVSLTRVIFIQMGVTPRLSFPLCVIRMVLANLRLALGALILLFIASGVTLLGYRLAGIPIGGAPPEVSPAVLLAGFASWLAFAYALVSILRMGFMLSAVVTAEPKGGLKRSHDLTEGNTWRAFTIVFALALPIVLLTMTAASLILRSALGPDFAADAITPDLIRRAQQAIAGQLLPWELFNAVIFVLYSGLIYSGIAFAYLAAIKREDSQG